MVKAWRGPVIPAKRTMSPKPVAGTSGRESRCEVSDFYWPEIPGRYDIEYRMGDNTYEGWPFEWIEGHWVDVVTRKWWTKDDMIANGYLGVRREAEKPDNTATAQQALDELRACQTKPAESERWFYKWGPVLCQMLGAR